MFARLLPQDDPKQALRIKRLALAFVSYLICAVLVYYCRTQGWLQISRAAAGALIALVMAIHIGFYIMFRLGLNQRFEDPSLTMPQMAAAILIITIVLFYCDEIRGAMLLAYIVAFIFGLFRLRLLHFFLLTLSALISYAVVVWLVWLYKPETLAIRRELFQWIVLLAVLPWFALIGAYINKLKQQLKEARAELHNAFSRIEHLAIHDDLTQVYNRRHIIEVLNLEKSRADRSFPSFSLAIIDLDRFKDVNDRMGRQFGDSVLKSLATTLKQDLRDLDFMARYGGEEFVLLLTNTGLDDALKVAERIRLRAESLAFEGLDESYRVTISIGLTEYYPVESIEAVLGRANAALSQAKANGRNRVESIIPSSDDENAGRPPATGMSSLD